MAHEQQQQNNVSQVQMLELMKQFAAELRKPSDEEVAHKAAEHANQLRRIEQSIARANREKQQREVDEAMCSHMKSGMYAGQTRIVAPLHGDGLHHPLCLGCNKEFKPFAPGPDTIPMGMSLGDFSGVTPQLIEFWATRYEKEHAATVK